MNKEALRWIVSDDTGISSISIWAAFMGVQPERNCTPCDPSDFGRCYRLLKAIPEFEARVKELGQLLNYEPTVNGKKRSNLWKVFADNYPELCKLYEEKRLVELYSFMNRLGF